jgi:hypothetical protein
MGENRLFWAQEKLDELVVDEKATLENDQLLLRETSKRYRVAQAVFFEADVGGSGDPHKLLGRVKETAALAELGAEHYMDSVLLGDSAYKVVPGFTGVPLVEAPAAAAGPGDGAKSDDRELLARFLLDNL